VFRQGQSEIALPRAGRAQHYNQRKELGRQQILRKYLKTRLIETAPKPETSL
jgi:hypothetical protein